MLIEHRGAQPVIHDDAYVAPTAVVSGDVTVAAGSRILHGAVVTAENGAIRIGESTVVMENALVRARAGHNVSIGDSVMVGPHAHINGATIDDEAFIATGASLFPGSVIGTGAEVRINAVVQVNTVLTTGEVVPIGWVAVGNPARLFSPDRHNEIWAIQKTLDFTGTVYGPATSMREIMQGQSEFYAAHRGDRDVTGPETQ